MVTPGGMRGWKDEGWSGRPETENRLSGERGFVVEHEKLAPPQLGEAQGTAFPVAELDLENFGCEQFDNCSDLATRQAKRRLIFKQRNDIEEFGGHRLHRDFHSA